MDTGKNIAMLRKKEGINQKTFAQNIGVSPGAVGMWETNRRQPDLSMLTKIAQYFNVTTDFLLGLSDEPHNNDPNFPLTEREAELIRVFRNLDIDNKDIIMGKIKETYKEQKKEALLAKETESAEESLA